MDQTYRFAAGAMLACCLFVGMPSAEERLEPPLTLAALYRDEMDPAAYWVSEKLDGVRAYWDGQRLFFRSGNPVNAPDWFIRDFPKTPLDGELWLGRGAFERLSGTVRKQVPDDEAWRQVRYMVFELPHGAGTFSERYEQLRHQVDQAGVPWLVVVDQYRVVDRQALKHKLDDVLANGGEGLMLHRADAVYQIGREEALLKLKPYEDREAVVIAHIPGTGRNQGRLGALLVEDRDGRRFRIGTGFSDAQRDNPPPIGSLISYRYRGLTVNGLPRFASFLRLREDN